MLNTRAALVIALVLLTLLTGCLPDYFPRRKLAGISESEVIGKWKLTQSYPPAVLPEDAGAEFLAGGRCTLHKFADGEDEISGDYTWQVDVEDDSKASVLYIAGFGTPQHPQRKSFYFTRKHGKLVLWNYIGDPDARHYIEYERM
jgi:hypothetical protein